jgi:hypothetical protein
LSPCETHHLAARPWLLAESIPQFEMRGGNEVAAIAGHYDRSVGSFRDLRSQDGFRQELNPMPQTIAPDGPMLYLDVAAGLNLEGTPR